MASLDLADANTKASIRPHTVYIVPITTPELDFSRVARCESSFTSTLVLPCDALLIAPLNCDA